MIQTISAPEINKRVIVLVHTVNMDDRFVRQGTRTVSNRNIMSL